LLQKNVFDGLTSTSYSQPGEMTGRGDSDRGDREHGVATTRRHCALLMGRYIIISVFGGMRGGGRFRF
jgi:hypothetical protein